MKWDLKKLKTKETPFSEDCVRQSIGRVALTFRVYLGVRACELFLCFVAIVRVRVYYVDFFVFFVLRHR